MKINFINDKYFKKRLAAGALALTLTVAPVTLTGCSSFVSEYNLEYYQYKTDENGNVALDSQISYDALGAMGRVIILIDKKNDEKYIYFGLVPNYFYTKYYYDILTGKEIYEEGYGSEKTIYRKNFLLVKDESILPLLQDYGIKDFYTKDDLDKIYDMIKEYYADYVTDENSKSTSYKRVLTNNNI